MRRPTYREQAQLLQEIMHKANLMQITGNSTHFKAIVAAMDDWSYAHRVGNGELSDRQQRQCVNRAWWRLAQIVRGDHVVG